MDSLIPLIIITVLILLNGVFVAAEFAIVGISRMEVERSIREGKRAARLVGWIVEDARRQDRFIATAQLGITAASLGLGMYGEHKFAHWIAEQLDGWGGERWIAAHTLASIAAITVLTYFHIVIGEMVPKALALQQPGRTARGVAPLMRGLQLIAFPLVVGLNGIGNGLLRLVGVRRSSAGAERYRTPEELAYLVKESQAGGLLRKESAQMVNELLEFADRIAGEVMIPRVRVAGLPASADRSALQALLRNAPHTRYPVYEGTLDRVVGMLHVRDALTWITEGTPLHSKYVRAVPHVPATATMDEVLAAMRGMGVQMAVVMDEHGGTDGIITLEDLFEEVVGDITEDTGEVPDMMLEAPGRLRASGSLRLEEVGEALGVVLEHEEVDTVSGLILDMLGRPPLVDDVAVYDGVRFVVASIRGNGVETCIASLESSKPNDVTGS